MELKSFIEWLNEKYKYDIHSNDNPYIGFDSKKLKSKLKSFDTQLKDLQRKGVIDSDEYKEMELKIEQVKYALKDK